MSPQIVCLFAEAKIRVGCPYKWSAEWQGPLPAREAAGGPTPRQTRRVVGCRVGHV